MAQFARPDADLHVGDWTTHTGGTTDLFDVINDEVADDDTFVRSPVGPANAPYACSLSNLEDPQTNEGHIVRYRYSKDQSGGAAVDLVVQLRQAYVSEASQGTLIASETHNDIPASWTAGSFTLSPAEADAITDYTDLQARFLANQPA